MAHSRRKITVTPANEAQARASASMSCLIANAMRDQGLIRPRADFAQLRWTDPVTKERVTALTPPAAQAVIANFDKGIPLAEEVTFFIPRPIHKRPAWKTGFGLEQGPRQVQVTAHGTKEGRHVEHVEVTSSRPPKTVRTDRYFGARGLIVNQDGAWEPV